MSEPYDIDVDLCGDLDLGFMITNYSLDVNRV